MQSAKENRAASGTDYIRLIEESSVYDVAIESPLEIAVNLSARSGNRM